MKALLIAATIAALFVTTAPSYSQAQSAQLFGGGILIVRLTNASNICSIERVGNNLRVDDGNTAPINFYQGSVSSIYVYAYGGADVITVGTLTQVDAFLTVFGGTGDDYINCGSCLGSYVNGGNGDDTILGTDQVDNISAGEGDDYISGFGSNDILAGQGGNDWIEGGSGNDTLNGNDGNDTLRGQDGGDYLRGGNGNDRLRPGSGELEAAVLGGPGTDAFYIRIKNSAPWATGEIPTVYPMDYVAKEKRYLVWK